MTKGIDVSTWQGKIDWNQVKNSDVKFAILRSSFGSPDPSQVDNQFENNYKGAKAAGIPLGAYHYGYAVSEAEARQEAKFFLGTIKGKQFEYPVYYDVEDNGTMGTLSRQALTNVIKAFCSEVERLGIMWAFMPPSAGWTASSILTSFPMISGLPSILLSASIPANMACGSTPAPAAFPESRAAWI